MAERPEDLNLPNAVITRIIKEAVSTGSFPLPGRGRWVGFRAGPKRFPRRAPLLAAPFSRPASLPTQLPDGVNVSKEARSAISRAASVFVLYATSW